MLGNRADPFCMIECAGRRVIADSSLLLQRTGGASQAGAPRMGWL